MWGPRISGLSVYGNGQYSGNILQGGVALQPQDYLLDGVTPLSRCIVVTGVATVAPDAVTGAAVFMAHNLVLIGSGASLSASTNCQGLCGYVNGHVALRGSAHLHMDKIGKAGNFGDISPDMLLPAALKRKIAVRKLKAFVVQGAGAVGAAGQTVAAAGLPGSAAGPMQTGGGGSGSMNTLRGGVASGKGGKGGPCCGGAGSGAVDTGTGAAAGDFGGPGGDPPQPAGAASDGAGAGDPVGVGKMYSGGSAQVPIPPLGAGGGLLVLCTPSLSVASGCIISSDGAMGGAGWNTVATIGGGGSAGGGCVVVVTRPGGYSNSGTVRAAGGPASMWNNISGLNGGPGGAGSVNTFTA
jgi:hypothetical protein